LVGGALTLERCFIFCGFMVMDFVFI
jgi:hypothetical protein